VTWTDNAACNGHPDPDLWFAPADHPDTFQAVTVCRGCPVRFDCMEHALRHRDLDGVWGGMTAPERARLRSRPGVFVEPTRAFPADVQPCGTPAAYKRHLRDGERPCVSCAKADARYKADRSAA
jgi:WhiB family transcriptional regulator, redox-sensing transcriptional regulator